MKQISDQIVPILLKYGVKRAALFGSYARGDYDEKSDVDVLFEPPQGMGMGVASLHRDLEDSLKKKVDLVSYNGISKYLKKYILEGQVSIL